MAITYEWKCEECGERWISNKIDQSKCKNCGHDSSGNLDDIHQ